MAEHAEPKEGESNAFREEDSTDIRGYERKSIPDDPDHKVLEQGGLLYKGGSLRWASTISLTTDLIRQLED